MQLRICVFLLSLALVVRGSRTSPKRSSSGSGCRLFKQDNECAQRLQEAVFAPIPPPTIYYEYLRRAACALPLDNPAFWVTNITSALSGIAGPIDPDFGGLISQYLTEHDLWFMVITLMDGTSWFYHPASLAPPTPTTTETDTYWWSIDRANLNLGVYFPFEASKRYTFIAYGPEGQMRYITIAMQTYYGPI
jgi:hypothetical protein